MNCVEREGAHVIHHMKSYTQSADYIPVYICMYTYIAKWPMYKL